jgi:hypothetical protein
MNKNEDFELDYESYDASYMDELEDAIKGMKNRSLKLKAELTASGSLFETKISRIHCQ